VAILNGKKKYACFYKGNKRTVKSEEVTRNGLLSMIRVNFYWDWPFSER